MGCLRALYSVPIVGGLDSGRMKLTCFSYSLEGFPHLNDYQLIEVSSYLLSSFLVILSSLIFVLDSK